jgi:hypothetical protein
MSKKKVQVVETTEVVVIENLVEAVVTEKRKPGRPVVEGSKRQLDLAAKMNRVQLNGGIVKRGRPIVGESKRQQRMAEREAKLEAGIEIKRGRPKMMVAEVTEA